MLKRTGTAAAVAWSAPVLTSLHTPAMAQQRYCGAFPDCGSACGEPFNSCGDNCICVQTVDGTCACIQLNVCCLDCRACTSSADCGDGCVCVNDNCFGDTCQPLCGAGAGAAANVPGPNLRA
jgi:hypothetical protein